MRMCVCTRGQGASETGLLVSLTWDNTTTAEAKDSSVLFQGHLTQKQPMLTECFCCACHNPTNLSNFSSSDPQEVHGNRYDYYPHFPDEKVRPREVKSLF